MLYMLIAFSIFLVAFVITTTVMTHKISFLQRDITTGLYRRLYIEQILKRLSKRQVDVTIAIVDVNGLREVNTKHGHRAGDELLKLAAKRLNRISSRRHWVGRLGGDEFVIVATKVNCVELANEIEESLHTKHPNGGWGLGVAGVARCRHGDTRSALECADMALLRAKRHFYGSREAAVYQYNSLLDGIPKVENRPVRRLREAVK